MLTKQRRLVKEKDFEKVFKLGKSYYTKLLGVKALAGRSGVNRYGLIVSAKVSKKASERNRLKRQLRAAAKELDKNLAGGFDMAVMALPPLLNRDYQTIKNELERVFIKLKLFNHA